MPSLTHVLSEAKACVASTGPLPPSLLSRAATNAPKLPWISRLPSHSATAFTPVTRRHPSALRTAAVSPSFPRVPPSGSLRTTVVTAAVSPSFPRGPPSGSTQEETIWGQIRELLGHSGADIGHWNYSPEWWGTQDGGWGRDEGITVFSKQSAYNGTVEVTAHPASLAGFSSEGSGDESEAGDETREEWRVLRFNKVTRQSVARVAVGSGTADSSARQNLQQRRELEKGQTLVQQPDCLASEYLKTMTALAAALAGLLGLVDVASGDGGGRPLRALCVGLGGGSLPLFLAHHYPGAVVDAVELDPVVVEAATVAMGLPTDWPPLRLHTCDAVEFVADRVAEIRQKKDPSEDLQDLQYDLIFIDAFDGDDNVPEAVRSPAFAADLAAVLRPDRGAVLMNFHSTDVREVANVFYDAIVSDDSSSGSSSNGKGCSFTVATQKQRNLTLVTTRGVELPAEPELAKERLRLAAVYVAHAAGYRFPAGSRSGRGYARLR